MENIEHLGGWLRAAHSVVAFTGAGISTESGIPDFRSPEGVWSRYQPVYYDEFVRSRPARVRYWKMRMEAYREFAGARPNAGHAALAEFEQENLLRGIITQNIDGLHQLAGSRNVIELHGTARVVACIACGREWDPEVVHARIGAGEEAPDCEDCGAPLKSKTISFGQQMPDEPMDRAHELTLATGTRQNDTRGLFLAIGSSLVVEPAASFPRLAKENDARLVIINATHTPLDPLADLIFRDPIGQTLERLRDWMERS
jgi:NAD-dependent deacetylase